MTENLYAKLYKDRAFADVTFVADGNEEKAHKCVLADRCEYFKRCFDQTNSNIININGTPLKIIKELVKFCYLQKIDTKNWSHDEKQCLHKLATEYNYGQLLDFLNRELKRRPEVPLSVFNLNEWYESSPGQELREWIKRNTLNIVNYEDCHKYTKDLIIFITSVFDEMKPTESNKCKLLTVQKKLLQWLFRWRNWRNRVEDDVNSVFSKLKLNFMSNDWHSWETPIRMKLSEGVRHFLWFREVRTADWKCNEVLELLCFAHFYEFGQLFDAVLSVVAKQYLKPTSLATIYGVARKLESSKLDQALVDYLMNNTINIFTGAEFTNYSARVVGFILDNLGRQVIDEETKLVIYTSLKNWRNSNKKQEVEMDSNMSKCEAFLGKLRTDLFINRFKDDDSKDVTFVFGEHEIKAHKRVLTYSCYFFQQLFDQNQDNRIDMEGTSIKAFNALIKLCYRQQIDLTHWVYSDKKHLYDLVTKINCPSLIDFVKGELNKRPKEALSVASLNEWYKNSPEEKICEWVKNNLLNIVNYEDCHKYTKDLVALIMDTFCELHHKETDKEKLESPLKKLLLWLFRWRNSAIRKEDDVQSLFARIRLPLVFKDRALGNKTLQEKLFVAVRRFCRIREVDTAGWSCDDVLQLLYFAHDYEFGPLVDAVLNVVTTQYLEPASLGKIHESTSKLQVSKLEKVMVDYIKNQTMIILSSSHFATYPASLVVFMLENMRGPVMDANSKNQLLTSLWNWKTSKSEEEWKAVFTKIQWEDFSRNQLAAVLRIVIPATCLAEISGPLAPAKVQAAKRKQSDNHQCRRSFRRRK